MASTWEAKGVEMREALKAKIPKEWRIAPSILSSLPPNVEPIIESVNILSGREIEITRSQDATAVLEKIHSSTWSAEEVCLAFCKRAALAHQLVNCLMDIDFEGAIKRAQELDEHLRTTGKVIGPLHGLPFSFKDHTAVKGMRETIGFTAWADKLSSVDAAVVKAIRKAGAVIYVKTTMPQIGMALETVSNLWGRTVNPLNTSLGSGGSSGGEGALIGCRGSPLGLGTDIGGSVRVPSAFNGLYGLKSNSRRLTYIGQSAVMGGQIAIGGVVGPMARSLRDIKLLCKTLCDDEPWFFDPMVIEKPWSQVTPPKKAVVGVMRWDEVVMPHPPIQRALKIAVEKLRAAGHEVVEFKPYKHKHGWDTAVPLYFPTAGREAKAALEGEPIIPAIGKLMSFSKPLLVPELLGYQKEMRAFQLQYLTHWNETASRTSTGKPIEALLAPTMASSSYPHDFLPWWGYVAIWNLLDYPAVTLPMPPVDKSVDIVDQSYVPTNDLDEENYKLYDPELYDGMPVSVQLIGRPLAEEKLLAVAEAIDAVIRS